MTIKDFIKAETERLGFPIFGVTRIISPPHLNTYQRWVKSGLHASMEYLARQSCVERRSNPGLILPEAESLLVLALQHTSELFYPKPSTDASGRIARYAWGKDYHDVFPPLIKDLLLALEKYLGRSVISKIYTDTGPVLERNFAQEAGLGWAGKNTCLIAPQRGSFFLLGEAFINVNIEPDPPFISDHCGSCRKCIESCPTKAIREDRTINAHQCISYQTIENKGYIPLDLRSSIGDWVFGCDICQEVCPWNQRFAPPKGHPLLDPIPEIPQPILRHELTLTPREFNFKFRHSPVKRAKRRGYLRNVCVALGNSGDTSAFPILKNVMENEPESLVRGHAAWALGQIQTSKSRKVLEKSLINEPDSLVMQELKIALAK